MLFGSLNKCQNSLICNYKFGLCVQYNITYKFYMNMSVIQAIKCEKRLCVYRFFSNFLHLKLNILISYLKFNK